MRIRRPSRWSAAVLALVVTVLGAGCADNVEQTQVEQGTRPQDVLAPEGRFAIEVDELWNLVFWIALVIFVLVELLLVVAILRFRERPGEEGAALPRQIHGNPRLEALWTVVPALILAFVAVPTVSQLFQLAEEPDDAMVVQVIGHQWWWEYRYPDQGGLVTANILHIPTGRTVLLETTSTDVIHSFWVPKLAGKQDAVPGRRTIIKIETDEPGEFLGQCAEFCGLSHANMRLRVIAHEPADFQRWAEQNSEPQANEPLDELAMQGKVQFVEKGCTACHSIRGYELSSDDRAVVAAFRSLGYSDEEIEGVLGEGPVTAEVVGEAPDLTYFSDREWFAGAIFENTDENLVAWLRDPPAMKPMQPGSIAGMPDLNLSDEEIDQLVAYLRTLTTGR